MDQRMCLFWEWFKGPSRPSYIISCDIQEVVFCSFRKPRVQHLQLHQEWFEIDWKSLHLRISDCLPMKMLQHLLKEACSRSSPTLLCQKGRLPKDSNFYSTINEPLNFEQLCPKEVSSNVKIMTSPFPHLLLEILFLLEVLGQILDYHYRKPFNFKVTSTD